MVKALAASSGMSFIVLSSADIYSPMVGDAEAAIRRAFALARQATPALLFFDEIDALVVNRDSGVCYFPSFFFFFFFSLSI
jgi:SpoVK/Ycf46/Vps4 family AAA+-type ATPase